MPADIAANPFDVAAYTGRLTKEDLTGYAQLAKVTSEMTRVNRDIQYAMVGNIVLYYFLKPEELGRQVRVVFPVARWYQKSEALLGNSLAGYFPRSPYGARFPTLSPKPGMTQILYIDNVSVGNHPWHWTIAGHHAFLYGTAPVLPAANWDELFRKDYDW